MLIPIVQFALGQIIYFSNFILSLTYILMFWLMIVAGYSLSIEPNKREQIFQKLSIVMLAVGLISGIIAILQWLNLSHYFSPLMYPLKSSRPYANMAQPNNLATLLIMSLLACLYLFEKRVLRNIVLIPIALIILFGIVLAQSRTTILVAPFIVLYYFIKTWKQPTRFNSIKLFMWFGLFLGLAYSLSTLSTWVAQFSAHGASTIISTADRVAKGSGDIRLEMWKQMWVAIKQQPWFGYGWNQTGLAQYMVFDAYQVPLWYKSAHNMLLDLLVWNGIPLGGLIILYVIAWLYWLNKGVKDTVSIVATLMVCAILIHSMLEFPLHYAYFLLPAGFLLGIIQAQYRNLPAIQISPKITSIIAILCVVGCGITVRDYMLYKQQSAIASQEHALSSQQQKVMKQEIILLTQFKERVWWIDLDPQTKMSDDELKHVGRMVANLASKYDLYKYAQVLAFNGKKQEAEHQLWILEKLHGQKNSYDGLFKD
uniref:PglL family O-oligosaccharyltransferase n=1 Tax=Acinetobacter lanii TaxID=2715163 RepID=UPI0029FF11EF|nr:Wzy polymerase domain-containing protein [Acinetobacter lanii]